MDIVKTTAPICTATKRDGSPCSAYATKTGKCAAHSGYGIAANPESAAAGARMVNQAKRERAEKRREAREMTLRDRLAQRLEERADAIIARLDQIVDTGNDSDALRTIEALLSRVYGKPTEHTVVETKDTSDLSLSELERERARLHALYGAEGELPAKSQKGKEQGL